MNATMVVSEAKAVPPVVSSIQDSAQLLRNEQLPTTQTLNRGMLEPLPSL